MNPFLIKHSARHFLDSFETGVFIAFHNKVFYMLSKSIKYFMLKSRYCLASFLSSNHPTYYLLLFTAIFSIFSYSVKAQNSKWRPPKGQFLSDSLQVGLPIKYSLSYRHKATADIFFPDSTFNFTPFELISREYFPTVTDANGSLDSAIYTLISFEVTPIQELSLPIFVRDQLDCTRVFAPLDYVRFKGVIQKNEDIDTLSLKKDTRIIPLAQQPNYPLIFLFIIGLTVLAVTTFWFFGTPIKRQIKLFQFKRRYDEYQRLFQRLSRATDDQQKGLENVEKAVILWKKYVERLESKPFTTFTTKEILDNLQDERLSEALREIDATVYGGIYSKKTASSLEILQKLAESIYQKHRKILVQSS